MSDIVPDIIEPIISYRYFRPLPHGYSYGNNFNILIQDIRALCGLWTSWPWNLFDENIANCTNCQIGIAPHTLSEHLKINSGHWTACGFNSFKNLKSLHEELKARALSHQQYLDIQFGETECSIGSHVPAKIQIWGKVIEHEFGWRSQYAKILALGSFPDETINDFYGVRIVARNLGLPYEEFSI